MASTAPRNHCRQPDRRLALPSGLAQAFDHVGVVLRPKSGRAFEGIDLKGGRQHRNGVHIELAAVEAAFLIARFALAQADTPRAK